MFGFAVWALSTLAEYLLRKRKKAPARVAPEPEERQQPVAEEGGAIAEVAGTSWVQKPMVLWQGDYATEPILNAGVTVGYRYFLGLHLGLCLGPIDRLIDVRFDQKPIPIAAFESTSGLDLGVTVSGVHHVVHLPAGPYESGSAASKLFTDAIHAQTPDTQTRIVYGYEIRAGWNDKWRVTIQKAGMPSPVVLNFVVRPAWYTDANLAAEINYQFNTARLIAGVADSGGNLVDVGGAGGEFRLLSGSRSLTKVTAANTTGLEPLGFDNFADTTITGIGTITALSTERDKFFFSVPPGTVIEWTHVDTTCESLFGMTSAGPDFASSSKCGAAVEGAIPQSTIEQIDGGVRVNLNAPDLFGGDVGNNSEGGVVGIMDVYYGTDEQPADDYLAAQAGGPVPTYRHFCHAVMRKLYQGNSAYLKNPSFVLEKIPNSLGLPGNMHRIPVDGAVGDDMNPACALFQLLTIKRYGLGKSEDEIDVESFRRAAETLYHERFGVSYTLDTAINADEYIDEIMRHIDGERFTDPETGLLTLGLIRNDYELGSLLRLGPDDVDEVELTCPDWAETRNAVKVRYVDRTANFAPKVLQIHDLAGIQMLGHLAVEEISLSLITNPATVQIAGERLLKVIGRPLKGLRITTNRRASLLRPVTPFILDWPKLGIEGLVCRAVRPRTGEIRNNKVVVEATEDPAGIEHAVYSVID